MFKYIYVITKAKIMLSMLRKILLGNQTHAKLRA